MSLVTAGRHQADLERLEAEVKDLIAAGAITNPKFINFKYRVDRAIEGTSKLIAEKHLYGKGDEISKLGDRHLTEMSHRIPFHYARDILIADKTMRRVKLTGNQFYVDCSLYIGQHIQLALDMVTLKALVITAAEHRQARKYDQERQRSEKFTEYKTLVDALTIHLETYINRAGTMASENFESWMQRLIEAGYSLDVVAPRPSSKDSKAHREMKEFTRARYLARDTLR